MSVLLSGKKFPLRKGGRGVVSYAVMFCTMALLSCIVVVSLSNHAYAFKLPDTGQTLCYDSFGNVIDCTGTGQDGAYNINPMSFTIVGSNSDMVQDNNTGLIWQREDDGNTYNWYKASGTYHATYNPTSQDVCGDLTTGSYTDWRLPSKKELMSIVDYSIPYPGPTINPIFTNTKKTFYWSSTIGPSDPGGAWFVYFGDGSVVGDDSKGDDMYVRCVRGGQSGLGNFDDNHDGTITNTSTGLMWQQSESGGMTWSNALNYCENLELPSGSGQTDWRLPNIKELESITDDTIYNPAIDRNFFPNASASNYWSSTTSDYNPNSAWVVSFYNGNVVYSLDNKPNVMYVRCVRGGLASPPPTQKGYVVTIDGMQIMSALFSDYEPDPSQYLRDAINNTDDWKDQIESTVGTIIPFIWSRDINDTGEAVASLTWLLKDLSARNKINKTPLVILSHSWGTVLAYLAINFDKDIQVDKIITLGSPLSSTNPYVNAYTRQYLEAFNVYPLRKPSNIKEWHNYWAFYDDISGKISSADRNYRDNTLYFGLTPSQMLEAAHTSYFTKTKIWGKILNDVIKK